MFQEDFVWGVASSAYQIEGTDPEDGRGKCIWDTFCEAGKVFEGQDAKTACDEIHRYREDFALMRSLGIKHYRFSLSWSRILPDGTGTVNEKAITMYRDMILEMRRNGIKPYITLFHWELPQKLQELGGWVNEKSVDWFGKYAKVVAERFSDLCDTFITINEPQCVIELGLVNGLHAPGYQLPVADTFTATHHLLMAHGMAVKMLRQYAKQPLQIGFAPTAGVAYPLTDSPEDTQAARGVYFGFQEDIRNWAWNVSWFSDPVFLGHYPEEGLQKYRAYLPQIRPEDLELIHQPLDFMGQNIYNGYPVRAGKDGRPEYVNREPGCPKTAYDWPVTPRAFYYGIRFLTERYGLPLYITENGMSCHDCVSNDGRVHDSNRITFLDRYISAMHRAYEEGYPIKGYFLWSFLDNFEWNKGYSERFGLVYVDYRTQQRIVKDSASWYQELMQTGGTNLSCMTGYRGSLELIPVCTHNIWGGKRLREDFGYQVQGDDIGECWGISAHPNGDTTILDGPYEGSKLSALWQQHPELFGHLKGDRFPLLTKIIDAREDLSIQVHPDDDYAKEHENGAPGKTECWYILDCREKDASIVIGHRAQTRQELQEMIRQGKWQEFIREIPIHKGDFLQIDPGTVHAIRGGTLLLETQQNSDLTYRVYDYDRLSDGKPRELHVQQSLDVITVPAKPPQECVMSTEGLADNVLHQLYDCRYYRIFKMQVNGRASFSQDYPFLAVSVTAGDGILNGRPVRKGSHLILPYGFGKAELTGHMELIASAANEV